MCQITKIHCVYYYNCVHTLVFSDFAPSCWKLFEPLWLLLL